MEGGQHIIECGEGMREIGGSLKDGGINIFCTLWSIFPKVKSMIVIIKSNLWRPSIFKLHQVVEIVQNWDLAFARGTLKWKFLETGPFSHRKQKFSFFSFKEIFWMK